MALGDLNTLTSCSSLTHLYAYSCNITDITGIAGLTGLSYLSLYSNLNLVNVSTLGGLSGLQQLYLANNLRMDDEEVVAALDDTGIYTQCGVYVSLGKKYTDQFTALLSEYHLAVAEGEESLTDSSPIIQKFLTRADVTNVEILDLTGNSALTNDTLQTMLKRMKNLKALSLKGCSLLSSIDFISKDNVTGLYELDLRNTAATLTDLSNLETYAPSLRALILNNYATDFSTFQTRISGSLYNQAPKQPYSIWTKSNYTYVCSGLILCGDLSRYTFGENCINISQIFIGCMMFKDEQSGVLDLSELSGLEKVYLRELRWFS